MLYCLSATKNGLELAAASMLRCSVKFVRVLAFSEIGESKLVQVQKCCYLGLSIEDPTRREFPLNSCTVTES